jgi:hypothetical protein
VELVVVVVFVGALFYGVHRLVTSAAARTGTACAEAAQLLGLQPVSLSRDEAAAAFLPPERRVHSDVVAFRGEVVGVEVLIAAFTHDSNTAMNGALIPITATHALARLPRPLVPGEVEISRRVAFSAPSQVSLGEPLDAGAVILTTEPDALARVLRGDDALARRIVTFLQAGGGNAFVREDACLVMEAYRDPARIRATVRGAAELARLLHRVASERAPLR